MEIAEVANRQPRAYAKHDRVVASARDVDALLAAIERSDDVRDIFRAFHVGEP